MKVRCEKCGEDLSKDIETALERYEIGQAKCPKCNTLQKRYISETDLQLYVGVSEVIYVGLTALGVYIYDIMGTRLWLILIFLAVLAMAFLFLKWFKNYIYIKAPFKEKTKNTVFAEDYEKVRKTMGTQFTIFFAMAFVAILFKEYRIEVFGGMGIIAIASLAKFYVCIRNEKLPQEDQPKYKEKK